MTDLTVPLSLSQKKKVPKSISLPVPIDYEARRAGEKRYRSEAAVALDDRNIEHLYVRGYSMRAIGAHLDLDAKMICAAVARIREQWQREMLSDFDAAIAEQLRKLDEVEMACWREFEESRQETEVEKESEHTVGDYHSASGAAGQETQRRGRRQRRSKAANVRFLEVIERCIEQRCKIMGLYAPKEIAVTQRKINTSRLEDLTTEELMQIAARRKREVESVAEAEYEEVEGA